MGPLELQQTATKVTVVKQGVRNVCLQIKLPKKYQNPVGNAVAKEAMKAKQRAKPTEDTSTNLTYDAAM